MKLLYIGLALLIFSGCVTITNQTIESPDKKALTEIDRVKSGMTYQEVQAIMGVNLVIGYEVKAANQVEPIKMANPARIEKIVQKDKTYFAVYYYTKVLKADQLLSDEELTPLIFESDPSATEIRPQDKLIGTGMDFLFHIKNN